jgi:hypothetical protein
MDLGLTVFWNILLKIRCHAGKTAISALRRQREEDCGVGSSLDYNVRPCFKKKKKKKKIPIPLHDWSLNRQPHPWLTLHF